MTAAQFKTAFPEFVSVLDAKIDTAIASAAPFFNVVDWDDLYARGLGYWVAHELTITGQGPGGTAGGSLASDGVGGTKQVGRVMIKKSDAAVAAQAADGYLRTMYGQEYARLARMVGIMGGPLAA